MADLRRDQSLRSRTPPRCRRQIQAVLLFEHLRPELTKLVVEELMRETGTLIGTNLHPVPALTLGPGAMELPAPPVRGRQHDQRPVNSPKRWPDRREQFVVTPTGLVDPAQLDGRIAPRRFLRAGKADDPTAVTEFTPQS
jgi:hypothetical protein